MPKILIFFSDTGGGHRAAAEAIKSALDTEYGSRYTTVMVDAIVKGAQWPLSLSPKLYRPTVTYAPRAWGFSFHASNTRVTTPGVNQFLNVAFGRGLRKILRAENPDLVVSVHPLTTSPIRRALTYLNKLKGAAHRAPIPFATVVTDLFDTHRAWYAGKPDLCIVPTEGARQRARQAKIPPDKLCVIGLPVSLKFIDAKGESQGDLRARLGLARDLRTILLVGGGEGMGKLFEIARALSNARLPIQLIVIAGRNPKLQKKLEAFDWQIPVKVTGFVTNMPDWMRASDLIITKAGPGTIMEALACGLPILLSGFLPGQEEGNVTFVVESGVGELVEEPRAIAERLRILLDANDSTLARWREQARTLARPRAALEIAAALDEVLRKT